MKKMYKNFTAIVALCFFLLCSVAWSQQIQTPTKTSILKSSASADSVKTQCEHDDQGIYIRGHLVPYDFFLVLFTALLWRATIQLVKSSEKTSRRQLRAYVALNAPHFGMKHPKSVTLKCKNDGQTPAYKVRSHLNWYFGPTGQGMPISYNYPDHDDLTAEHTSVAVLNPNSEQDFICVIDGKKLTEVQNGEIDLFYYGHIDYQDVFGDKKTTKFCYQYLGKQEGENIRHTLIMTEKHNDAT